MDFDIYLRCFREEDTRMIHNLRMILEIENLIGGPKRFVSFAKDEAWVKSLMLSDNISSIYLAICKNNELDGIGYTSISEIDHRNKTCFWSGIKIIPGFFGNGYGFQAGLSCLKYCFEELNIQRVIAHSLEEHKTAENLLSKLGFVKEGLMRQYTFKNGEYKNVWLWSILNNEYEVIKESYDL